MVVGERAKVKARPVGRAAVPFAHYRIRNDRVGKVGKITVHYVGRTHQGERVALGADRDVRVLFAAGELLSHAVIDPDRIYQPKLES
ncbi:MAG: hypothetical protein ACRDV6_00060 [Acidimicrobiales bacterium]